MAPALQLGQVISRNKVYSNNAFISHACYWAMPHDRRTQGDISKENCTQKMNYSKINLEGMENRFSHVFFFSCYTCRAPNIALFTLGHTTLPRMVHHNFQKYSLTPLILRRSSGAKICFVF